jgi:uncharacterized coiled-coil DUF342 family protein
VTPRAALSDEAERDEREDRERLRSLDAKLADLHRRRQSLLEEVYRLSDAQKSVYHDRQAQQARLEQLHGEHQALGRSLSDIRRAREAARRALDEALGDARMVRTEVLKSELPRPDQIRREIALLEHKQQTTALPLSEENQLVDRLRELSKLLSKSGEIEAVREQHQAGRRAAEERVRAARLECDRWATELSQAHHARDRKMQEMQQGLVEAGRLVAALREKAKSRAEVMGQVDGLNREIGQLEREGNRILDAGRARRLEARRAMQQYSPRAARARREERVTDVADAQLQELMRRGRVTLGGSP